MVKVYGRINYSSNLGNENENIHTVRDQQDIDYIVPFFFFKSPATSVKTPTEQRE